METSLFELHAAAYSQSSPSWNTTFWGLVSRLPPRDKSSPLRAAHSQPSPTLTASLLPSNIIQPMPLFCPPQLGPDEVLSSFDQPITEHFAWNFSIVFPNLDSNYCLMLYLVGGGSSLMKCGYSNIPACDVESWTNFKQLNQRLNAGSIKKPLSHSKQHGCFSVVFFFLDLYACIFTRGE